MTKIYTIVCASFFSLALQAQKPYFQQEVHYDLQVTLDDRRHTLTGTARIEYINRSPDDLSEIYMHLWGNAYASKNSAFAKQFLRNGDTRFNFAAENDLGKYDGLLWTVDGKAVEVIPDPKNTDIVRLKLVQPLKSGGRLTIATPFKLYLPANLSRSGHIGQSYQATQWYPKPAVYDATGWHAMPYLDQGEFYSEFGTFDVSLTLPKNYVVAATGELQTPEERTWMTEKILQTEGLIQSGFPASDSFPRSEKEMKTIRFTASNVHDFAWFADKRFHIQQSEVKLKKGKKVATYVFYTNAQTDLWKNAIKYVDRSVRFYSGLVGAYPYSHATAVQNAYGGGGGMEYPMITLIGGDPGGDFGLDDVITHEIGHNWFYGILGSNERDFAWMDEGINTYYENRYTRHYYPPQPASSRLRALLFKKSDYTEDQLTWLQLAKTRQDQPVATTSNDLTTVNYQLDAYDRPARDFLLLENYYGAPRFDSIMQVYFQTWKFKHPQPADLKKIWETATGDDLGWFFDQLLGPAPQKVDYAIRSVKATDGQYAVTVENKGTVATPFPLSIAGEQGAQSYQWIPGFQGTKVVNLPKGATSLVELDPQHLLPDIDRSNNSYAVGSAFPKILPLRLTFLAGVDNSKYTNIYYSPLVAYNYYDRVQLGVWLHNGFAPLKKFEWSLAPMISLRNGDLTGLANADYHFRLFGQALTVGVGVKRFDYDYFEGVSSNISKSYTRFSPTLTLDFAKAPTSPLTQRLQFRSLITNKDGLVFDTLGGIFKESYWFTIHELAYTSKWKNSLGDAFLRAGLEQQSYTSTFGINVGPQHYLKGTLELRKDFLYAPDKKISIRAFGGYFLDNSGRNAGSIFGVRTRGSLGIVEQGFNDYKLEDFYFGRSESTGLFSQQITPNSEGGFKVPLAGRTDIGFSNDYLLAFNFKTDLPIPLPIKPYFDVAYYDAKVTTLGPFQPTWVYSGGLALELGDYAGIYFPLPFLTSTALNNILEERGDYFSRISFHLNLKKFVPGRLFADHL